jgi:DNA polymerase III epsilon subunit-like protein
MTYRTSHKINIRHLIILNSLLGERQASIKCERTGFVVLNTYLCQITDILLSNFGEIPHKYLWLVAENMINSEMTFIAYN